MAADDKSKDPNLLPSRSEDEDESTASTPARLDDGETAESVETMKDLARGRGIQSLWAALLPMVGVRASRAGEFPGIFQVEPGPGPNEALVHIDIPDAPYAADDKPTMNRVISLSVTLAHDFRRLGDRYYCIDCEAPADETRH